MLLFLASYREATACRRGAAPFLLPSGHECLLLVIAGGVWMVYTSGFSGFASYLPTSLAFRGYGLAVIAAVMTIATWGNVPATLAGGGLAARFGGFNIFLAGTFSLAVGMVGCALTGWPVAWAVLLGVGGSIQPGVIMAVGTLSARPENRAVGMGLFYTMYYLGGTFAPALCGVGGRLLRPAGRRAAGRRGDFRARRPALHAASGVGVAREDAGPGLNEPEAVLPSRAAMHGCPKPARRDGTDTTGHPGSDGSTMELPAEHGRRHVRSAPTADVVRGAVTLPRA